MARVKNPLMSLEARGKFTKASAFRGDAHGSVAIRRSYPGSRNAFSPSQNQLDNRAIYGALYQQWSELSAPEKADYDARASLLRLSGWNLFLRENFTSTPEVPAWNLINSSVKGSTDGLSATTDAIDTSAADLIVVYTAISGTLALLSDNKANSWTPFQWVQSGSVYLQSWYCANPSVGSGHTFTSTSLSAAILSIAAIAFSGADSSPLDATNWHNAGTASSTVTGSITPTVDNELILFATTASNHQVSPSVDMGQIEVEHDITGSKDLPITVAYLVQETSAPINPTFSFSASCSSLLAKIASFKHS